MNMQRKWDIYIKTIPKFQMTNDKQYRISNFRNSKHKDFCSCLELCPWNIGIYLELGSLACHCDPAQGGGSLPDGRQAISLARDRACKMEFDVNEGGAYDLSTY